MSDFSLALPSVEEQKAEIVAATAVEDKRQEQLVNVADTQVQQIMDIDFNNLAEKNEVIKTIDGFGGDAIASSNRKNDFLSKRIMTFKGNSDETSVVARNLTDLSVQMKNLDPTGINFSEGFKSKILNPVRKYFAKYEKADTVIEGIIDTINNGKRQLENDNKTLMIEQQALETETEKLNEYIAMGNELDVALSAAIENAKSQGVDEKKISFLETEVLFPLRQKVMDMGTLVVVNYQGIGAIDIIRKNNKELIRGVDRACQVSVSALRIGVMCAQALYNQKIVLSAINTLNEATGNIIEANAQMLGKQSNEIQELSANPMIAVEKLQSAFNTVFDVMDTCEQYKQNALPQMAETVRVFAEIGAEGAERIKRIDAASQF